MALIQVFTATLRIIPGVLSVGIIVGCASGAAPAPPPVPEVPWVRLDPDFRLASVERPQNAAQRYGPQALTVSDSAGISRWLFEDQLVRVLWMVSATEMAFHLQNKSDYSVRLVWEQAAFVNVAGESHPVMHIGTRYSDCRGPKTSSVVVRGASIEDRFIGCDRVRYSDVLREWRTDPIAISEEVPQSAADSAETAIRRRYSAKRISALLPIQIEGVVNDYLFSFELSRVVKTPCKPLRYRAQVIGCIP